MLRTSGLVPVTLTVIGIGVTAPVALLWMEQDLSRLDGAWNLHLIMDKENRFAPPPAARTVSGTILFSDTIPDPWTTHGFPRQGADPERYGRSRIDLTPFFGARVAPDVSWSVFGGADASFFDEAVGSIISGDSVGLVLIPRISHGGLSLRGVLRGDSVVGTWLLNAYCCGAEGRFVMTRIP